MIGCRKTIPHSGHWYSAAPSASQMVSTTRRVCAACPNGHGTVSAGAVADQSATRLDHRQRVAAGGDELERLEVVAARGDRLRARAHGAREVLEDRGVGDLVLLVVAVRGIRRQIDRLTAGAQ